jgi:predicted flavoprotein YhiN
VDPYPALTPLTGPHPDDASLAGVSLDVDAGIKTGKRGTRSAHRTGFLFTHKGRRWTSQPLVDATMAHPHGGLQLTI